jgi:hypothetical protein
MNGDDCRVGKASIKAQPAHSSKASRRVNDAFNTANQVFVFAFYIAYEDVCITE